MRTSPSGKLDRHDIALNAEFCIVFFDEKELIFISETYFATEYGLANLCVEGFHFFAHRRGTIILFGGEFCFVSKGTGGHSQLQPLQVSIVLVLHHADVE